MDQFRETQYYQHCTFSHQCKAVFMTFGIFFNFMSDIFANSFCQRNVTSLLSFFFLLINFVSELTLTKIKVKHDIMQYYKFQQNCGKVLVHLRPPQFFGGGRVAFVHSALQIIVSPFFLLTFVLQLYLSFLDF